MKGYVYVLSNPSYIGLIKVGSTHGRVSDRMTDIYCMDVPEPFVLEGKIFVPNAELLRKRFARNFSASRVNPKRNFYRCDAYTAMMNIAGRYSLELFSKERIKIARDEFARELFQSRLTTSEIITELQEVRN